MADELEPISPEGTEEVPAPEPEEPTESEPIPATASGDVVPRKAQGSRSAAYVGGIVVIVLIIAVVWTFTVLHRAQRRATAAQTRLAHGQAAVVDGDLDLALFQFTMALELNPQLPGAHLALGQIALVRGRGLEAGRHFKAELEISRGDRQSHLALGCLYALACIDEGDPYGIRPYLLTKFVDVLPVTWSEELTFSAADDVDPLARAVFHFQYAAERLPADPAPCLGLALAHLANYDLQAARKKLSRLSAETEDELTFLIVQDLLEDINEEEQYQYLLARAPAPWDTSGIPFEPPGAAPPADYPDGLEPLPPVPAFPEGTTRHEADSGGLESAFGSRPMESLASGDSTELSRRVTPEDLIPQPSVKPVSDTIFFEESMIPTVRIANIYTAGSRDFREGETITMPNTETEVQVVEASEDRIVLRERDHTFTWVPGEVGWVLDRGEVEPAGSGPIPPDVIARTQDEGQDAETESVDREGSAEDEELGPEVPGE